VWEVVLSGQKLPVYPQYVQKAFLRILSKTTFCGYSIWKWISPAHNDPIPNPLGPILKNGPRLAYWPNIFSVMIKKSKSINSKISCQFTVPLTVSRGKFFLFQIVFGEVWTRHWAGLSFNMDRRCPIACQNFLAHADKNPWRSGSRRFHDQIFQKIPCWVIYPVVLPIWFLTMSHISFSTLIVGLSVAE